MRTLEPTAVQVVGPRRLDGGVLLGHDADELGAVRVLVEELYRAFAADRERQNRLREDDGVPKGKDGYTPMDLALIREL